MIYTDMEEVHMIFNGNWTDPYPPSVSTEYLLEVFAFNGGDIELVSRLDRYLRSGKRKKKTARDILLLQRISFVKKPWRYYAPKDGEKKEERVKVKARIKSFIPI